MQKTIKKAITVSGVGLHTGQNISLTLKPAKSDQGIYFYRVDLPGSPSIKLGPDSVLVDPSVSRCSIIETNGVRVVTVEHLLAALHGLGIDNLIIELNGPEVPGLDGSSLEFVKAIKSVGIEQFDVPRRFLEIQEPILVSNEKASILIVPSKEFEISYTLDYDSPVLRTQTVTFDIGQETFLQEIAPARTFCLESEAKEIRARGLGKGANHQNTLVISDNGPLDNKYRFEDECARHKVLDIVGDLFLLGVGIRGKIHAIREAATFKPCFSWVNRSTAKEFFYG